jgi:hypothetical protein
VRWGEINFLKDVITQDIVESQDVPHKRTGVVKKRVQRVVDVRKIRHARIYGNQEIVTAVVYEGSEFEKVSKIPFISSCPDQFSTASGSCRAT